MQKIQLIDYNLNKEMDNEEKKPIRPTIIRVENEQQEQELMKKMNLVKGRIGPNGNFIPEKKENPPKKWLIQSIIMFSTTYIII